MYISYNFRLGFTCSTVMVVFKPVRTYKFYAVKGEG